MNKKQVETRFKNAILPYFKETGFTLNKKTDIFIRKTESGFDEFFFTVLVYAPEFFVNCNIALRVDAIEDLSNKFGEFDEDYPDSDTTTLSVDAGYLMYGPEFKKERLFAITHEEDINQAADTFIDFMKTKGEEFYRENCHIAKIDSIVNEHPETSCKYCMDHFNRAMTGIAVAKLNNNPNFNDLCESYWTLKVEPLRDKNCHEEFQSLASYLKGISSEKVD